MRSLSISHKHPPIKRNGFTIVELLVIIVVLGILATLGVVGFGSWRTSVAKTEVKSDLSQLSSAMTKFKNFSEGSDSGYPVFPENTQFKPGNETADVFKSSKNVLLTYVSGDKDGFCVNAHSLAVDGVDYYLDTTNGTEPAEGTCAGSTPPADDGDDETPPPSEPEEPTPPSAPSAVADDFNRSGTDLGVTSVGSLPWQAVTGTWKTNGSKAKLSAKSPTDSPVAVVDYGRSDADARLQTNPDDALYFRVQDADNWWRLREQTRTESYTYQQPYTYYTYSWQGSGWSYSGAFCETADYYPATGTYYTYDSNGNPTLKSVHNGVGSGGCKGSASSGYGCGSSPCINGFQVQDYTQSWSQVAYGPYTGYTTATGYTTYYNLVLEKSVGGTVSQVWTQSETTSPPSLARIVASGNDISVYNSASGSALKTVSDGFNASATKFGIGRGVSAAAGSSIDNFSLAQP